MPVDVLTPSLDLLSQEYLLVQAWKKASSFIRYHNWYSDTLALDRTTVNLPQFLGELAEKIKSPNQWTSDPIRIVPAPKSQRWHVHPGTTTWEPAKGVKASAKLRPLAHVSLQDQVAATAVMLCLADRVETIQGDPRLPASEPTNRKRVASYGNRLFCDSRDSGLRHRWGSSKLYRSFFQDYRAFLARPEQVAETARTHPDEKIVIVHSDLRQFYDRVRPGLLASKLEALMEPHDDPAFASFAKRLLNWSWDVRDNRDVAAFASQAGIADYGRIALPQGLVAAGFFANVVLLDFDEALRGVVGAHIADCVRVLDVSRYVDDLRIVLAVRNDISLNEAERDVYKWLEDCLAIHAHGLLVSPDKTKAAVFQGDERPLLRHSRKMQRIQRAVSGGFDAAGGEGILDAVHGLVQAQKRFSEERAESQSWKLSPIPDVRDATVARFAASRFRFTYRSLRPLLDGRAEVEDRAASEARVEPLGAARLSRTREDIDDEAQSFAYGLVESWVEDPSNVRLLRIGLDLWPAPDLLAHVLDLIRPFTEKSGRRKGPRRVAWYCLAEVLRAGATETGLVDDEERLPKGVDVGAYRLALTEEAVRVIRLPGGSVPWYVKQQALLFLASVNPVRAPIVRTGFNHETAHHRELIRFLRGEAGKLRGADFATLAVLARRSFLSQEKAVALVMPGVNSRRLENIADRDPAFALEILDRLPGAEMAAGVGPRLRADLCLDRSTGSEEWRTLAEIGTEGWPRNPLRNEPALLRFAIVLLDQLAEASELTAITPCDVWLGWPISEGDLTVRVHKSRMSAAASLYRTPAWCGAGERWRFQLGYLLRFILCGRADFTKPVRAPSWREGAATYRAPDSHSYQRHYGLFSGHAAFGDDWLPMTEWVEGLLLTLLKWPGCSGGADLEQQVGIDDIRARIMARLMDLASYQGLPGCPLLPLLAARPDSSRVPRALHAFIVQTVVPALGDFPDPSEATRSGLSFSDRSFRRRHRRHLSAALAAVERMLELRMTHNGGDGALDLLILPELAVHPEDVKSHLIPFARTHRTIILAGLTYEQLWSGQPLVNSALWIIPKWSNSQGLQVLKVRQGKQHLSPDESKYSQGLLQGFRPCQWLIGYEWAAPGDGPPLWLSGAICYDATDLSLVAKLRAHSDVFAISALNKDVKTFDNMAMALHYHMFQLVVVANNGGFGGSSAYAPFSEDYRRQVFHLHGQPQASIGFVEIDDIGAFLRRRDASKGLSFNTQLPSNGPRWKSPPAGM